MQAAIKSERCVKLRWLRSGFAMSERDEEEDDYEGGGGGGKWKNGRIL